MGLENIKYRKIGNYVDNDIDRYRAKEDINFKQLLDIYVKNNGFFVLINEQNKPIGYLDMRDSDLIKKMINDIDDNKDKTILELKQEGKLKFRKEFIEYDERVIDVLRKLDKSLQNYYPVIKEGNLVGRISKRILKEKIDELY